MGIGAFIVDDQEDIRLLVKLLLEAANDGMYVKGLAASGEEALERIDELDPEIVILDHMMPGLTGIETAARIRASRPRQHVVLFSAYLDRDVERRAAEVGIDACVRKEDISRLPGAMRLVVEG